MFIVELTRGDHATVVVFCETMGEVTSAVDKYHGRVPSATTTAKVFCDNKIVQTMTIQPSRPPLPGVRFL